MPPAMKFTEISKRQTMGTSETDKAPRILKLMQLAWPYEGI